MNTSQKVMRRIVASGALRATRRGSSYVIYERDLIEYKAKPLIEALQQYRLFGDDATKSPANVAGVNWADISTHWNNPDVSEMTYVDLFCGCGGLSKGLEMSVCRAFAGWIS